MSALGGYRSPVDLGLGRSPSTTDPVLHGELTEVYNAIHLLNEYLDTLRTIAGGGGAGQLPTETAPFSKFVVGNAFTDLKAGDIVGVETQFAFTDFFIKGVTLDVVSAAGVCNFSGIVLKDALAYAPVRVGLGPAMVALPNAVPGNLVYAYSTYDTATVAGGDGALYYGAKPANKAMPGGGALYPVIVGVCVTAGYILLNHTFN